MGGQPQQIGQLPAALIGHQGQGAKPVQGCKAGGIQLGIQQGRQGLLQQHHAGPLQGLEHGPGCGQIPAAVGIHLQLAGAAGLLAPLLEGASHPLQQGQVVGDASGTAQLELDAGGRQLQPPALEPRQDSLGRT